ncbi:MAG: histidine kinase, partial [Spirochaetaceae bacterium]|nr:histidine kinase [Spirochaetaceae bacterium]
ALKWTAMLEGRALVGDGIGALSFLLRNNVFSDRSTITLADEIANLQNYVLILKLRFGDSFRFEADPAPDTLGCEIPRLILQPFIENAVFHGIREEAESVLSVVLTSDRDGDALVIRVSDDGRGFDAVPEARDRDRFSGIGIPNVQERIRLWYGDRWGATITSCPGGGTVVELRLPAAPEA